MNSYPTILLRKGHDRRIRGGHSWIFSNEIDTQKSNLEKLPPGQAVRFTDYRGNPLGMGYVNPHSLIAGRLLSREVAQELDRRFLESRLAVALRWRDRLFAEPYYRLVYGDSDSLPGLVVDRFGDVVVAQIGTAGMEVLKDTIVTVLDELVKPRAIVLRNDSATRAMENLPEYVAVIKGDVTEDIEIREGDCRFGASVLEGQKTGWFYDHRNNRRRAAQFAKDKSVLDVFSYVGGWGIQAAHAGARSVLCVDSSAAAVGRIMANGARNGVQARLATQQADAFDALKSLKQDRQRFDVVILDPPAFIQKRKDKVNGLAAYRRLNEMALQVLEPDGILVSASCSYHLTNQELVDILARSAHHNRQNLQIVEHGHQAQDHPVHPAIPETDYLKAYFCRLLPGF